MSGGLRLQLRPNGEFAPGEFPLEGEPIWDGLTRKIGFYNFDAQKIQWFRIPGEGENENYVPAHEWNDQSIRWRNPDGTWGDWTNLAIGEYTGLNIETNQDRSITLTLQLTATNGELYEFAVTSEPLGGSDGWSPVHAIATDGQRRVLKVIDWIPTPATDPATKPDVGMFVGTSGYVELIADGSDLRGPIGISTGDMIKSVYDTNNNGKVDVAEVAESVDWSGIQNLPTSFTRPRTMHRLLPAVFLIWPVFRTFPRQRSLELSLPHKSRI